MARTVSMKSMLVFHTRTIAVLLFCGTAFLISRAELPSINSNNNACLLNQDEIVSWGKAGWAGPDMVGTDKGGDGIESSVDLSLESYGLWMPIARSTTSASSETGALNNWWSSIADTRLIQDGGTNITVLLNAYTRMTFDGNNAPVGSKYELVDESGTYKLRDKSTGTIWRFNGFSSQADDGFLIEKTSDGIEALGASGEEGWVVTYDGSGHIDYIDGPVDQAYHIDFTYSGDDITTIVSELDSTAFAKVEYKYRTASDHANTGSIGDLIGCIISTSDDGTNWEIDEVMHCRCTDTGGMLEAMFTTEDLIDIANLNSSMDSFNNTSVLYTQADSATVSGSIELQDMCSERATYYEQAYDASTLETKYDASALDETDLVQSVDGRRIGTGGGGCCGGGASGGGLQKDYFYLDNDDSDVDTLVVTEVKDGSTLISREIRGLDDTGRLLRYAFIEDPDGASPKFWCESWKLDSDGYITEHRLPSAHNIQDGDDLNSFLDPGTGTNDADTLHASAGVIETFGYDGSKNQTWGKVKHGRTGTEYYVFARDFNSDNRVTDEYSYTTETTTKTNGKKTSYTYTYWSGSWIKKIVKTLPSVSTSQNGSGVATTSEVYYDEAGNLRWTKDGEDYINYFSYHPDNSELAYTVLDANPTSLPTSASAGANSDKWHLSTELGADSNKPTRSSGLPTAKQYVAFTEFDEQARPVLETDSSGYEHKIVYEEVDDKTTRSLRFPYWASSASQLPIQVAESDKSGRVIDNYELKPGGTSSSTGVSNRVSWIHNEYEDETGNLEATRRYHDIPSSGTGSEHTNYHTTEFQYDSLGRQDVTIEYVKADVEQVTKQEFDVLDRPTEVYRIVSDDNHNISNGIPSVDSDDLVSRTVYDDDEEGGDGRVTHQLTYYGVGSNSVGSETLNNYGQIFKYTYRGHLRGTESIYDYNHSTGAFSRRWYTVSDLDWSGNATASARFGHQTGEPSSSWSSSFLNDYESSDATASSTTRHSLEKNYYDDLGRLYRTEQYDVSVTTPTKHFRVDRYYDRNDRIVAVHPHGRSSTERVYDGVGREYQTRTVNALNTTKYSSGAFDYRAPEPDPVDINASNGGNDEVVQLVHRYFNPTNNIIGEHTFFIPSGSDGIYLDGSDYIVTTEYWWYDTADLMTAHADYGCGDSSGGAGQWKYVATIPSRGSTPPPGWYANNILTQYSYNADSKRLEIVEEEPQVPDQTGTVDGKKTKTIYDDLGRVSYNVENYVNFAESTESGTGGGDGSDDRVVKTEYDGLNNVVTLTALDRDGSGGGTDDEITRYFYEDSTDASLVTNIIYPDSSETAPSTTSTADQVKITYYRDGLIDERTDQRAVTIRHEYLAYGEGRRLSDEKAVSIPSSVDPGVRRIRRYYNSQGRNYLIRSYEGTASSITSTVANDVFHSYSSKGDGNIDYTYQSHGGAYSGSSPKVSYGYDYSVTSNVYDDNGRLASVTYPNGKLLSYAFSAADEPNDLENRVVEIEGNFSGTTEDLVNYAYTGQGQHVRTEYEQSGVEMEYDANADDEFEFLDRHGRVKSQRWVSVGVHRDRYNYVRDAVGNITERNVEDSLDNDPTLDQAFIYDDGHRLVEFTDGSTTPIGQEKWSLDSWGNWENFQKTVSSTYDLQQDRTHNDANELTGITDGPGAQDGNWADPAYDEAGNMTSVPDPNGLTSNLTATYDAWNRLVKVEDGSDVLAEYEYDGLHRRIIKTTDPGGAGEETVHFYYNLNWQVLETRIDTETDAHQQFVWHPYYVDALAVYYIDGDDNGSISGFSEKYHALFDANFNVTAISPFNNSGAVIERYEYTPYGGVKVLDADFSDDADGVSDVLNSYTYTGRRLDPETGLYQFRHRYYHPQLGRFVNRDPIEYGGGLNLYGYTHDSPTNRVDPLGLDDFNMRADDREFLSISGKIRLILAGRLLQIGKLFDRGRTVTLLDDLGEMSRALEPRMDRAVMHELALLTALWAIMPRAQSRGPAAS